MNLRSGIESDIEFCTENVLLHELYQGIHRFTIVKYDFHITYHIKFIWNEIHFEYDLMRILIKLMILAKTQDYKNNYSKKIEN